VTALLCGAAWSAGVDVRGGGPGGRETDALSPENLVGRAHAVVLAGGSVFGLAAADGVTAALSRQGNRLTVAARPRRRFPSYRPPCCTISATAAIKTGGSRRLTATLGFVRSMPPAAILRWVSVGAGRGAMAGLIKGGIGSASLDLGEGLIIGALVALNFRRLGPDAGRQEPIGHGPSSSTRNSAAAGRLAGVWT